MIEYLALDLLLDGSLTNTYKERFFWAFMIFNSLLLLSLLLVYLAMKKCKHWRAERLRKQNEEMIINEALEFGAERLTQQSTGAKPSEYRASLPLDRFFSNGSEEESPYAINSNNNRRPVETRHQEQKQGKCTDKVTIDCTMRLIRIVTRFIIVLHIALFPVILYAFGYLNIVVSCLLFIPCIQFNLMQGLYRMNKKYLYGLNVHRVTVVVEPETPLARPESTIYTPLLR